MKDSSLPDYINNGLVLPVPRGPYTQKNIEMANFILQADHGQLKTFCDEQLNAPMNGEIRYVPLCSNIMLTYARSVGYVLDENGTKVGLLSEQDLVFWILTAVMKRELGGLYIPERLVWYPAYIFVDNPYALATGREVYGFPKTMGTFMPPREIQAPELTVEAMVFDPQDPDAEGKMEWYAKVSKIDGPSQSQPAKIWKTWEEAAKEIITLLTGSEDGKVMVDPLDTVIDFFLQLLKPEVHLVFLKQFRAASDTTKACYQAIVEAPIKVTQFDSGGLLDSKYQLTVNQLPHYPIVQNLGIQMENGVQEISFGSWMEINFQVEAGREIWAC